MNREANENGLPTRNRFGAFAGVFTTVLVCSNAGEDLMV